MKKSLISLITFSTALLAGAASANCAFHKGTNAGPDKATMDYRRSAGFVLTGGYQAEPTKPDIVDTAIAAGSFNTLVKAAQEAGLVEVLKGEGPFTVFAPTDAAFAKLPDGVLDTLLADKTKLAEVLKYHVVPGKLNAKAVTGMSHLATVEGSDLPVSSIKIADTDIVTSNGIIHVIDEVLIPQS